MPLCRQFNPYSFVRASRQFAKDLLQQTHQALLLEYGVLREDTGGYVVIREDPAKPTAGWIRVWLTFFRVAIWQVESIQLLHLSESSLTRDLEPTTLCEVSHPWLQCARNILWRILSLPLKRLWKWVMISLFGECLWQDSKRWGVCILSRSRALDFEQGLKDGRGTAKARRPWLVPWWTRAARVKEVDKNPVCIRFSPKSIRMIFWRLP